MSYCSRKSDSELVQHLRGMATDLDQNEALARLLERGTRDSFALPDTLADRKDAAIRELNSYAALLDFYPNQIETALRVRNFVTYLEGLA